MLDQENQYLFKYVWRSITRNPGRSFFIGFSVSLAVVIAVWVIAFFDGLNKQIEEAVVKANVGTFQIHESHYAHSTDSSFPEVFTEDLKRKLTVPEIKSFSPELILDGNIATPEGSAGLVVLGVDPRLQKNFLPLYRNLIAGEFLDESDQHQVLIGEELAREFKFKTGDQLVLNYQDKAGELRSELLTIKGIYQLNGKIFERRFMYLNQRTWQTLFLNEDTGKTLFNRIAIISEGLKQKPLVKEIISGTSLKLKSWKQLNPEMAVVLEFHDGMIKFFFLIIAITITMTILTPVRMLWQERFKELRMLSTLGVSIRKFWKIGIIENVIMIGLSTFASIIVLVIIIGIQSYRGVDFRFLNNGVALERAGIQMPGIVYPYLSTKQLAITFLFVIFILSSSYIYSIFETLKKLKEEP